jgi:hypothetical protein
MVVGSGLLVADGSFLFDVGASFVRFWNLDSDKNLAAGK